MNRIQRKREKGWRMPENTIYVGRPTKWGNPMKIIGKKAFIQRFHQKEFVPYDNIEHENIQQFVVDWYKSYIKHNIKKYPKKFNLDELRGKNLSCFCSESHPCHVDVLLELITQH